MLPLISYCSCCIGMASFVYNFINELADHHLLKEVFSAEQPNSCSKYQHHFKKVLILNVLCLGLKKQQVAAVKLTSQIKVANNTRAVTRSENQGGLVVLGGDNVPHPGWDRVNWSVKNWPLQPPRLRQPWILTVTCDIIDRPYCSLFGTEHLIILSTLTSRGQIAQNVWFCEPAGKEQGLH